MTTIDENSSKNNLFPEHLQDLRRSGLSDATIAMSGVKSLSADELEAMLQRCNIQSGNGIVSAYVIPFDNNFGRYRIFPPIKKLKYLQEKGSTNRIYIPPTFFDVCKKHPAFVGVTEGCKKSLKACQEGIPCVATTGIWCWKTKGPEDSETLLPDFDRIGISGKSFVLVFDSDIGPGHVGHRSYERLAEVLKAKGAATVKVITLPESTKPVSQCRADPIGLAESANNAVQISKSLGGTPSSPLGEEKK